MKHDFSEPARAVTRAKHLPPVNVATLLRKLQSAALTDRSIAIALDVDEALHVAVDAERLSADVGHLLDKSIETTCTGGRIILRCCSEPRGVVIEIEQATSRETVPHCVTLTLPL